jgi:hypothetical protein
MRTNRKRLAEWIIDIRDTADEAIPVDEWVDRIYFDINHGIIAPEDEDD